MSEYRVRTEPLFRVPRMAARAAEAIGRCEALRAGPVVDLREDREDPPGGRDRPWTGA